MQTEALIKWEKTQLRSDQRVQFKPGDTVRVYLKIVEGERERLQSYEGVVIRVRGVSLGETFMVRRVSFGVGIERTFPVHSPVIQKIAIVKRGKVRRARLYYLRGRVGRAARVEERVGPVTSIV